MTAPSRTFSCPNCGAELEARLRSAKLIACSYCDSNVFLEDDAVRLAGKQGVMADYPSLIQMHGQYRYRGWQFMAIGRARFDYGQGFWDEWWVVGNDGEGRGLAVDEGDFALEEPLEVEHTPSPFALTPGSKISLAGEDLYVTERGKATCIGVQGELPEVLSIGDSYSYFHLSGVGGRIYTLEVDRGRSALHRGHWLDPFEIETL
jgi:DNA-directed RNA polymerase subunit RPC12/RpoP